MGWDAEDGNAEEDGAVGVWKFGGIKLVEQTSDWEENSGDETKSGIEGSRRMG